MKTIPDIGFPAHVWKEYVFAVERVAECRDELAPLHRAQWNEIEKERPPFNPDYDRLEESEHGGTFFMIVVRLDGEAVGNLGFFVFPSIHTKRMMAEELSFYIAPAHRKGFLASQICKYAEAILRALSVSEVQLTVKEYANTGKLLERLNFRKTDTIYMKNLEACNVQ